MAENRVLFLKGTAANYALETKNENAMYFCTDTKELYVGSNRFGLGDMGIAFYDDATGTAIDTSQSGALSGKVVTKIEKDPTTNYRTLKVFLGTGVTSAAKEEIISAITAMLEGSSVISYTPDSTDPTGEYGAIDLVVDNPVTPAIGDVTFTKGANGLSAEVTKLGVKGVKSGEQVVSVDANEELSSTLTLAYDNTGSTPYLQIKGIGGAVVTQIDATPFIKDGMLDSVSLVAGTGADAGKTFLHMVFNTDASKQDIDLDVTDLIDVYTAGNGINITNNVVSLDHTQITAETTATKTASVAVGGSTTIDYVTYDINGLITGTGTLTLSVSGLPGGTVGASGKILSSVTLAADGTLTGTTIDVMDDGQPSAAGTTAMDLTTALSAADKAKIPTAEVVYDTVQEAVSVWGTFGS